jgi:hypothetical protein
VPFHPCLIPVGTPAKDQLAVTEFDRRGASGVDHLEQVALPPHEMAFPVEILAWRLALLFEQLLLLPADPRQFRDREDAEHIHFHPQRRRDGHPPGRRMHAEVDVLDVLADDGDREVTECEIRLHQYSVCAQTIRKSRSTSASSWSTS